MHYWIIGYDGGNNYLVVGLTSSTGPIVFTAIATKECVGAKAAYFCSFIRAACEAAAPAVRHVAARWEAATVYGVVASQTRHFPRDHGVRVA